LDPRVLRLGKVVLRAALSATALYIVWLQIDLQEFYTLLRTANPLWLIGAVFLYTLSKVLSSLRLTRYFTGNKIFVSERDNLRLYFVGMFYNLFLPGGIGGDGYKIWYLQRARGTSVARAFQSVFFDRISGMFALFALGLLAACLSFPQLPMRPALLIGAFLAIPLLYVVHRVTARQFLPAFAATTLLSLGVQAIQLFCAFTLLKSIGLTTETGAYLTVFLVSSLVAVLPISIGGIGLRELVFVTAAGFSQISRDGSVAFSLLFFFVTAIVSLPGALIAMDTPQNDPAKPDS
jgi:uncharacterized membrane protein YbhN (UPF0104 family)